MTWAKPLFKARLPIDGKMMDNTVAWVYERFAGKTFLGGRSYGVTLGHFHENWRIESLRRMLVNGILWTAGLEIPRSGAPVEITEKDMELPDYWK